MQDQLKVALADRIAAEFSGAKGRDDGRHRPVLDRKDCEFIVSIVLSEIGRTSLGVYDVTSERGGNADRSKAKEDSLTGSEMPASSSGSKKTPTL